MPVKNKQPTAIEYITTYGWIILIIIVIISAVYSIMTTNSEELKKETLSTFCESFCFSINSTPYGSYGDTCRCKERICEGFIQYSNKTIFGVNCEDVVNDYLLIEKGEINY